MFEPNKNWIYKEILPTTCKTNEYKIKEIENQVTKDEKQLFLRNKINTTKKSDITTLIKETFFKNSAYKNLYRRLTKQNIAKKKSLKNNAFILNYMGNTKLDTKKFKVTQTKVKFKKSDINDKTKTSKLHFEVSEKSIP